MGAEYKSNGIDGLLGVLEDVIYSRFTIDALYSESGKMLERVDYKLKDVEAACPLMAEILDKIVSGNASGSASRENISLLEQNIGVFVSAAINRVIGSNEEAVLDFKGAQIDFLGMYLEKGKVVVDGSAGYRVGYGMKKGSVVVVKGDVKGELGHSMCGGDITVRGDAGENVGIFSKDGRIWLHGNYTDLGPKCCAKVYYKYIPLDNDARKAFETYIFDV